MPPWSVGFSRRIARAVWAGLAFWIGAAAAGERVVPSWMAVDGAAKTVEISIESGWNANNSSWNFNGYYEGGMSVVVPVGWRVGITLRNRDGNLPHSLVVTEPYPPDQLPEKAGGRDAAIKRAYTNQPEMGLAANQVDSLRFKALPVGRYHLFCGIPGHGRGGMWTGFEVRDNIDTPFVEIADSVEPGRE